MAVPVKPTLGELTHRLAVRTGFAAQGGASTVQRPILQDFLQSAQTQLVEQLQSAVLYRVNDDDPGTLSTGMTLYDVPDDCDPERIETIRPLTLEGDAPYPALKRGITAVHRATDSPAVPSHYEIRRGTSNLPQIEVWPAPDAAYPLRLEYYMRIGRFVEDTDKVTIEPEIVFLHALAAAKSHYRQNDAEAIAAQMNSLLGKYRAKQHKGRRYTGRGFSSARSGSDEPPPRPRRV